MFFIYASFLEFIAVNYLARLNQFHFFFLKNINFYFLVLKTLHCARWVQDPDQQKKKKENAILDVSKIQNTNSNNLALLTSCVPDPKFHVKAVVAPNHNVLKVAENRDRCTGRPLRVCQGRHAQHWRHCRVKAQGGEEKSFTFSMISAFYSNDSHTSTLCR